MAAISLSSDEREIAGVLPGGPTWMAGVRTRDQVLSLETGDSPDQWVLRVLSPDWGPITVPAAGLVEQLRERLPRVLLGCLLLAIALPALRIDRRVGTALAAVAVCCAEAAMLATGEAALSSTAAVIALLMPAAWIATYAPHRSTKVLWMAVAIGTAAAWLVTRHVAWQQFSPVDTLRLVITFGGAVVVGVIALGSAVARVHGGYDSRRMGDLAILVTVSAVAVVLVGAGMPVLALAVVVLVPLLSFPMARTRLAGTADRLVHGDLREQASAEAVEAERARVARELHDEALQRLADVIRRLDGRGLADETDALRGVASQLREVTTSLQPPVLQDVGVGAALRSLIAGALADVPSHVRLELELDDRTTPDTASRPPADVEMALFRIAQEATTNAIRHSGAERIVVTATVHGDHCRIVVADDGVGIDPIAARTAGSRGRLGLRSMEQRAALIGADLAISDAAPGTVVTVEWRR